MTSNRLLILDDDPAALTFLGEVGRKHGYAVALTASIAELQETYPSFEPSAIVLDLQYGQGDGIEVLGYLKQRGCRAPVVLVSGYDERVLDTARRVGAEYGLTMVEAFVKPVPPDLLGRVLDAHREPEPEEWATDLRGGLARGEVSVWYQPKVRVADGSIVGFEALARWTHPIRGPVGPERFVPMAEATGLIGPLTEFVLLHALADCASWTVAAERLSVAINLSPRLLDQDRLVPDLLQLVGRHQLPAEYVVLEITESAAMHDPALTLEILGRLRLRGFNLALDDFGTGYSNLALLHRMPFTEMKIDRSFVHDLKENRDSRVIVRALTLLARQFGMTTVVEGVEDLSVWPWLRSVGVEQVQGYGIASPMPAEAVVEWIGGYAPPQTALGA